MDLAIFIRSGFLIAALGWRAQGSLLVGNDTPAPKNLSVAVEGPQEPAISFTMPTEAYSIDSVTLSLRDYDSASDTPSIGFYTDKTGQPGTLVGTPLRNPYSASDRSSDFTFFPNGSLTLNPGQTYWVLVSSAQGSFSWNAADNTLANQPRGAASFGCFKVGLNYGSDYVEDNPVPSFTIHATAVPEPSIGLLGATGALAFLAHKSFRRKE